MGKRAKSMHPMNLLIFFTLKQEKKCLSSGCLTQVRIGFHEQRQKLPLTRGYGFQPGIRELWLNIGFSVAIECVKYM